MTSVRTHVRRALGRVADEREHLAEKRAALDEFGRAVRDLGVDVPNPSATRSDTPAGDAAAAAAPAVRGTEPGADRCRSVRDAFAETVRPYSVDDVETPEPLVETMRAELTDDLAAALAPGSGGQFTPMTKRAVLSAVADRKRELTVTDRALDAEARSLRSAADEIETVVGGLVEANETPLSGLDFTELRARHNELRGHRTLCAEVCRERQEFLHGTTSLDADVGITHRSLVEYAYSELSVSHPVLSTATRLIALCAECQRTVRDHLVRRV